MSSVREKIRVAVRDRSLSLSRLSKEVLGKNHAYLQQYLERGSPERLPEEIRTLLAPVLGLHEDELREGPRSMTRAPFAPPDRLPVLGMAECGPDGWSLWNGDVIDTIPKPSGLAGAPGAYAVYVVGNSMEPRYYPGEVAHIHPGRPVTIGSFVLVQKKPGAPGEPPLAVIKRLARRSATKIVLEQFNPPKTFDLKLEDMVSIHKVVGSGES
jgi:phage repressor protein C with HTH and peptisase S24 domain